MKHVVSIDICIVCKVQYVQCMFAEVAYAKFYIMSRQNSKIAMFVLAPLIRSAPIDS